jgi:hypothetical protein
MLHQHDSALVNDKDRNREMPAGTARILGAPRMTFLRNGWRQITILLVRRSLLRKHIGVEFRQPEVV